MHRSVGPAAGCNGLTAGSNWSKPDLPLGGAMMSRAFCNGVVQAATALQLDSVDAIWYSISAVRREGSGGSAGLATGEVTEAGDIEYSRLGGAPVASWNCVGLSGYSCGRGVRASRLFCKGRRN